jgi:hypothetical protein
MMSMNARKRALNPVRLIACAVWLLAGCATAPATTPSAPPEAQDDATALPSRPSEEKPAEEQGGAPPGDEESATPFPTADTAGWQTFQDSEYGVQISFPPEWTVREINLSHPQLDLPVVRIVQFLPQAWADQMQPGAAPDPENLPMVAPVSLEISAGTLEEYRVKYAEPSVTGQIELNGYPATWERDSAGDFNFIRYVFQHPANENVRITVVDQISAFSTRAQGHEDIVDAVESMLTTVELTF